MLAEQIFQQSNTGLHVFDHCVITCWQKLKVLRSVVRSITIDVVDMFMPFQGSTKHLAHYKAMLINFASLICHRVMNPKENLNITAARNGFAFERSVSMFFEPGKSRTTGAAGTRVGRFAVLLNQVVKLNPAILTTLSTHYNDSPPGSAVGANRPKTETVPMNYRTQARQDLISRVMFLCLDQQIPKPRAVLSGNGFSLFWASFWPGHFFAILLRNFLVILYHNKMNKVKEDVGCEPNGS